MLRVSPAVPVLDQPVLAEFVRVGSLVPQTGRCCPEGEGIQRKDRWLEDTLRTQQGDPLVPKDKPLQQDRLRQHIDGVQVSAEIRETIQRLLADKLAGREMDDGPRIPVFHEFFDTELARLEKAVGEVPAGEPRDYDQFDALFRSTIGTTQKSG